jgi:hypothetical protein
MSGIGMELQSTGVRLGVTKNQERGYWSKEGFDVKGAVDAIRKSMMLAPKAKYLLAINLSAYPEFTDEHPDETWVNDKGQKVFGHNCHSQYWLPKKMDPKRHWYWVSNHSLVWRDAVNEQLTKLIDELKRTGLSRLIVGVHLSGYHDGSRQLVAEPFAPNFWRASLDNDWRGWKPGVYLSDWKTAPEYLAAATADIKTAVEGNVAVINVIRDIHNGKALLGLTYSVYPDGKVKVSYDLKIGDNTPEPLRVGLQGQIAGVDKVTYFGRGPQENYSDRNDGIFLGTWTSSVAEMMMQYVFPQENGNRTDVRWIRLSDAKGKGLKVTGEQPLSVSVWNTTQDELDKAKHIGEAKMLEGSVVLNVDLVQTGVGGTDSWSQKARPYDRYRLTKKEYSYSFWLSLQ